MLEVELRSGVTVVEVRHGKVNALDLELLRAITAAMHDIDGAGPVVITGAGRAFCAGVDLQRQLQQPARDQMAVRDSDDAAVLALWEAERTREGIASYLRALKSRSRQAGPGGPKSPGAPARLLNEGTDGRGHLVQR